VSQLNQQIEDKHITITLDDTAKQQLIEDGFDAKMGARPLQRVINTKIKLPLSKKILFEGITMTTLTVSYDKDQDEYIIGE